MTLKEYRLTYPSLTFKEFLKLDIEEACQFDFLRQGGEPDSTKLIRNIYALLFPFDGVERRGDTMNTYRKAIQYHYSYYYVLSDRKEEILDVIQRNTMHGDIFCFEFLKTYKKSKMLQISNNYQLGNFCVFPSGKINAAHSYSTYNDYFDRFLHCVKSYYNKTLVAGESRLAKQMLEDEACARYFLNFKDFDEYIEKNYFQDYLDENHQIKDISHYDTFEEYVIAVNDIIQRRGKRMFTALKENSVTLND